MDAAQPTARRGMSDMRGPCLRHAMQATSLSASYKVLRIKGCVTDKSRKWFPEICDDTAGNVGQSQVPVPPEQFAVQWITSLVAAA